MADLIVSADLDHVNADLKDISAEFQHAQDNADPGAGVWGQRDVTKAMHDFAHNWYVHRDKIQGRLSSLSGRVDKACTTWAEGEKQLAEQIGAEHAETGRADA
jgi:hypothetical protein